MKIDPTALERLPNGRWRWMKGDSVYYVNPSGGLFRISPGIAAHTEVIPNFQLSIRRRRAAKALRKLPESTWK